MNDESKPQHSIASDFLDDRLVQAIADGNREEIVVALSNQEPNLLTEAISNRLVVRGFLADQKSKLIALDGQLSSQENADQMVEYVRQYLQTLRVDFTEAFVGEKEGGELEKLSGDKLFREALSESGESLAYIARQVTDIDATALTPPDKVFDWMEHIRESIIESLWDVAQDIREDAYRSEAVLNTKQEIHDQIAKLDWYIQGSLPS